MSTCELCGSKDSDWCTYNDKYAGGEGPLMCLRDGKADVAFMRSIDLDYLTTPQYGVLAYNPQVRQLRLNLQSVFKMRKTDYF